MNEDLKNEQQAEETDVTAKNEQDQGAEPKRDERPDFNQLLKEHKEYQSAFDRQVQNAIDTARSKWEKEAEAKQSEAEKLAAMNADEKERFKIKKEWDKISEKQKELEVRELKSTAAELLTEKGLSHELTACLNFSNADACKNSIEALDQAIKNEVERQVNARFRSATPKEGANPGNKNDFQTKYTEAKKTGNMLEMIRIKTEAAAKGEPIN